MKEAIEKAIQEAQDRGLCYFGLRKHHEAVNVGDDIDPSFDYVDDSSTYGEELSGTSAIQLCVSCGEIDNLNSAMEAMGVYTHQSGPLIVIAGMGSEFGDDSGEILIQHAEVIHIIN